MNYQEAVTAAAGALRRGVASNWELAELTYTHTLRRGEYQSPGDKAPMAKWCEDVRVNAREHFSPSTGYLFRAAWEYRITCETDVMPSFNDVVRELRPGSRDPATVQARVDKAAVEKLLTTGTPEAKREVFERLQADPAVVPPAITLLPAPSSSDPTQPRPPAAPPESVAVAQGALRLAVFVLDARVAAQHYAQALGEADLDPAGLDAEAAAIDTVLHAWERLRLILHAPGGIRLGARGGGLPGRGAGLRRPRRNGYGTDEATQPGG